MSNLLQTSEAASRGFDSGNYANAYVSEDFALAWKQDTDDDYKPKKGEDCAHSHYRAGFVVGFWSTYEDSEVPGEYRDELEAARITLGVEEEKQT